ncbi:hypothetical protein HDU88_003367 [Geranomyces variabilis]|nr:hypothetical protein HDU88_003367 [Geranomyces variabilis]
MRILDEIHQTNGRSRPSSPARWSENHETVDLTDAFEPPPRYTRDPIDGGGGGSSGSAQKRKRNAIGISRSTTPTADSRNYGSGTGSSVRLGSRRHNIYLMQDLDTDEAWFTPTTAKTRGLRTRRLDCTREDSGSGQQTETPSRLAQNGKADREQRNADWQPIMSDAERHRRHKLFIKSLLKLYRIGENHVASTPAGRLAKRNGVSSSLLRESVAHRKRKEMEPEIVVDTDNSNEIASPAKMPDREGSAARSKSGTARTSRPATPPRKSLSSVLHRSMAPVALNKEDSPKRAANTEPSRGAAEGVPAPTELRPETKGETTFSDWDPFAEDLDVPASPETFLIDEVSQVPDTGYRTRGADDGVTPSSSPLVARARERAKPKAPPVEDEVFVIASQPESNALHNNDEPVVMDTPTKTPTGLDSDDEDEADRLLMSTPGLASASKSTRDRVEPARTGTAQRPLLNSMLKRTARVSPSAHTSPSPAVPKEGLSLTGSSRNGGASSALKGKGPPSPPPVEVMCPLCRREFAKSAIEQHASTCDGLRSDNASPPRRFPSPPPPNSKQSKLAALARKRRRKAQGRMEDDIENSSSEESDAGPSIISYFPKAQPEKKKARVTPAKAPPARQQRTPAATSRAASEEDDDEEEEAPAQCKSCGAFVARSQLRAHEAGCKSKRSNAPPPPEYDDPGLIDVDEPVGWDDEPPVLPTKSASPAPAHKSIMPSVGTSSRPAPAIVHNLDPEPGDDEPNAHFFWQQSAPLDLDDNLLNLGPERDDDEQLSPLQGFENMDEEEGRLDWFNADTTTSATKSAKKARTPKAESASKTTKPNTYGRGGWRGGWKRGNKRGGGGGRSGAGRSMPSRGDAPVPPPPAAARPPPPRVNHYANHLPAFSDHDVAMRWEGFNGISM